MSLVCRISIFYDDGTYYHFAQVLDDAVGFIEQDHRIQEKMRYSNKNAKSYLYDRKDWIYLGTLIDKEH